MSLDRNPSEPYKNQEMPGPSLQLEFFLLVIGSFLSSRASSKAIRMPNRQIKRRPDAGEPAGEGFVTTGSCLTCKTLKHHSNADTVNEEMMLLLLLMMMMMMMMALALAMAMAMVMVMKRRDEHSQIVWLYLLAIGTLSS